MEDTATDAELSPIDKSNLASIVGQPGFQVLQRLFKIEVEKFKEALLNTSPVDRDEVLAAHNLAKAAAMFYEGITARINEEINMLRYINTPPKPEESVTTVLDFGESAVEEEIFLGGENG